MKHLLLPLALGAAGAVAPTRAAAQPAGPGMSTPALPTPRDASLPNVFYIGDSTVRNGRGNGANGEWGWGDLTGAHLDTTRVNVVNRALGGRSSRTYITQGQWDRALALVRRGDVVVIQFGHNDGGALDDTLRARGTIRGVGDEADTIDNLLTKQREIVRSYGWYLRKYVADVRARGATPVIASPVPRNVWEHGAVVRDRSAYAGWAEQVARAEGVAFVDLNELVAREYEALGAERVKAFFPRDHTHTSLDGARLAARIVASALQAIPGTPVSR